MAVGTKRNKERSEDRDLEWSKLMRLPDKDAEGCDGELRSMDMDVSPWCNRCGLPIMLFEVTRETGYKGTRYTHTLAQKIGVKSYLIRHNLPESDVITVEDLKLGGPTDVSKVQFVRWVEKKMAKHIRDDH